MFPFKRGIRVREVHVLRELLEVSFNTKGCNAPNRSPTLSRMFSEQSVVKG